MRIFVTGLLAALLLAACAHTTTTHQGPWTIIEDDSQTAAIQKIVEAQKAVEKPSFALDRVIVLRMSMEGQRVEVTSIAPNSIVAEPNRGNRTVFNLNDRKNLVLFTRDGLNVRGYRMQIPLGELVPGKEFRFPVAQDPGVVVVKSFAVEKVIDQ